MLSEDSDHDHPSSDQSPLIPMAAAKAASASDDPFYAVRE
jgi:hypothetical protein